MRAAPRDSTSRRRPALIIVLIALYGAPLAQAQPSTVNTSNPRNASERLHVVVSHGALLNASDGKNGTNTSGAHGDAARPRRRLERPRIPAWVRSRGMATARELQRLAMASSSHVLRVGNATGKASHQALVRAWRRLRLATERTVEDLGVASRNAFEDLGALVWQRAHAIKGAVVGLWRTFWRRDRAVSRILRRQTEQQWYHLLQVRRKATPRQLKDAYRRIAKRVHPDKTRDDRAAKAFQALRDALDLLLDEKRRARYDQELARQDRALQQQRERRRAVAKRAALRTLRAVATAARSHPGWACGGVLLLYLLIA